MHGNQKAPKCLVNFNRVECYLGLQFVFDIIEMASKFTKLTSFFRRSKTNADKIATATKVHKTSCMRG